MNFITENGITKFPWYFYLLILHCANGPLGSTYQIAKFIICALLLFVAYMFIYQRVRQENAPLVGTIVLCVSGILMGLFYMLVRVLPTMDIIRWLWVADGAIALGCIVYGIKGFPHSPILRESLENLGIIHVFLMALALA